MIVRALASDLDGTLLLDDAQELDGDVFDLVRELTERGTLFVAASGRQYANLRRLFAPVKDQIAYVCENGCLTFYRGEMVSRELMDRDLGRALIEDMLATEGTEVLVSGQRTSYILAGHRAFLHQMRDVVKNDVTPVDDLFDIDEPYFKISIFEPEGLRDEDVWQRRYGDLCTVVTGGAQWLDMMPKGVGKETGLLKLLAHVGVSPENTVMIGDNDNDVGALRACGYPVAMRSGRPSAKEVAREQVDLVGGFMRELLRGERVPELTLGAAR